MTVSLVWSRPLDNHRYHNQLLLMNEHQLCLTVSSYLPEHDLSYEQYNDKSNLSGIREIIHLQGK